MTAAAVAGAVPAHVDNSVKLSSNLAINGGPITGGETSSTRKYWVESEQQQLNAAIGQDTLFYWKGPYRQKTAG